MCLLRDWLDWGPPFPIPQGPGRGIRLWNTWEEVAAGWGTIWPGNCFWLIHLLMCHGTLSVEEEVHKKWDEMVAHWEHFDSRICWNHPNISALYTCRTPQSSPDQQRTVCLIRGIVLFALLRSAWEDDPPSQLICAGCTNQYANVIYVDIINTTDVNHRLDQNSIYCFFGQQSILSDITAI